MQLPFYDIKRLDYVDYQFGPLKFVIDNETYFYVFQPDQELVYQQTHNNTPHSGINSDTQHDFTPNFTSQNTPTHNTSHNTTIQHQQYNITYKQALSHCIQQLTQNQCLKWLKMQNNTQIDSETANLMFQLLLNHNQHQQDTQYVDTPIPPILNTPIPQQTLQDAIFIQINDFVCQNLKQSEKKRIQQQNYEILKEFTENLNKMQITAINPNLLPFQLLVYFSIKCDKFQGFLSKNLCFHQKIFEANFQQFQLNENLIEKFPAIKKLAEQVNSFYELFIYSLQVQQQIIVDSIDYSGSGSNYGSSNYNSGENKNMSSGSYDSNSENIGGNKINDDMKQQEIMKEINDRMKERSPLGYPILNCMDSFLFRKTKYQDVIKQCIQRYDYIYHGQYLYDIEKQRIMLANQSQQLDYNIIQKYGRIYDNITFSSTGNWCQNKSFQLMNTYIYPNNESTEVWQLDQEHGYRVYNKKDNQFPISINKYQTLDYVYQYPQIYPYNIKQDVFNFAVWRQGIDQTYIKITEMNQKKIQVTCYLFDEAGHNFTYSFNTGKNDIRSIPVIMESYKQYQEASQFEREFITCNGVTKQFDKKGLDQNTYFKNLELDKFIQDSREKMKRKQSINELQLLKLDYDDEKQWKYIFLIVIFLALIILQYIE